ncbi:MAG: hypothetical protein PHS64_06195, partial [Candidatus Omnitrophica bacterium]|nr:hypothetical protein [Candidatus Omnitrophota bacterium]
ADLLREAVAYKQAIPLYALNNEISGASVSEETLQYITYLGFHSNANIGKWARRALEQLASKTATSLSHEQAQEIAALFARAEVRQEQRLIRQTIKTDAAFLQSAAENLFGRTISVSDVSKIQITLLGRGNVKPSYKVTLELKDNTGLTFVVSAFAVNPYAHGNNFDGDLYFSTGATEYALYNMLGRWKFASDYAADFIVRYGAHTTIDLQDESAVSVKQDRKQSYGSKVVLVAREFELGKDLATRLARNISVERKTAYLESAARAVIGLWQSTNERFSQVDKRFAETAEEEMKKYGKTYVESPLHVYLGIPYEPRKEIGMMIGDPKPKNFIILDNGKAKIFDLDILEAGAYEEALKTLALYKELKGVAIQPLKSGKDGGVSTLQKIVTRTLGGWRRLLKDAAEFVYGAVVSIRMTIKYIKTYPMYGHLDVESIMARIISGDLMLSGDLVEILAGGQVIATLDLNIAKEYQLQYRRATAQDGGNHKHGEAVIEGVNEEAKKKALPESQAPPADIAVEFDLTKIEAGYFRQLNRQFIFSKSGSVARALVIGEDFTPSAYMSKEDRENLLGAVEYAELIRDAANAAYARNVRLVLNPLNGGIGKAVGRVRYLESIWQRLTAEKSKSGTFNGDKSLGAKAMDLYFEVEGNGRKVLVSVAEAKLLRSLEEAKAGKFSEIVIQELVSSETAKSIHELFDIVWLGARLDTSLPQKTYHRYFNDLRKDGVVVSLADPVVEHTFPIIDKETGAFRPRFISDAQGVKKEQTAPGGHGLNGFWSVMRALDPTFDVGTREKPVISSIYNEDGMNNMPDEVIAGWMARNAIPIVMVTTTKTGLDMKGGQIGIQRLPDGRIQKSILELKQASNNGQEDLFKKIGLTEGQADGQYFNTGMILLNYAVLRPFLTELVGLVGEDEFESIIAPVLIKEDTKDKKSYSLGGSAGSVLLNLAAYVETSNDPGVIELARKHGLVNKQGDPSILYIVNAGKEYRTKFFTPIKTSFDYWLQYHSDLYRVNTHAWQLEQLGQNIPVVDLKDDWYKEVVNVLNAFEGVKVKELTDLTITGVAILKGSILKGKADITGSAADSKKDGGIIVFAEPNFRTGKDGYTWGAEWRKSKILQALGIIDDSGTVIKRQLLDNLGLNEQKLDQ